MTKKSTERSQRQTHYHCLLCGPRKPFWDLARHHRAWHRGQKKEQAACTGARCMHCKRTPDKPGKYQMRHF